MRAKHNNTKTFKELYNSLLPSEKHRVTLEIIDRCNVSIWTIRSWIVDSNKPEFRTPKPRTQGILAEMFGSTPEVLFPPTDKHK